MRWPVRTNLTRFSLLLMAAICMGSASAQCLSGDCKNGQGKFDYGYATYEGAFRSGEPHGQGTMDYGGGEKYVGGFVAGKEEGEGILFKGGAQKVVQYRAGILQVNNGPVVIGGNPIKFDGGMDCTGDCYNGTGTAKFPSGNVYTGTFKDGLFHGRGKMRFASGNVLEGEFETHIPQRGTFTYAKEGTVFTGTFNPDGTPATGTYNSAETGGIVQVRAGAITSVSNPRLDSIRAAQPKYSAQKCSRCNGAGFNTTTSTSYELLTPSVYRAHSSGFADLVYSGQSAKRTTTSTSKCAVCSGSGRVQVRQK